MRDMPACEVSVEVRTSARLRHRASQGGFMLLVVLGTVLFLSIVGLAIMSFTVTSSKIATSLTGSSANLRAIDAALEIAVNTIRSAPIPEGPPVGTCENQTTNYTDTQTNEAFTVKCTDGETPTPAGRTIDLVVTRSSGGITLGQARVKIADKVNETTVAGYSVEVCDWQLGVDVAPTLKSCPS